MSRYQEKVGTLERADALPTICVNGEMWWHKKEIQNIHRELSFMVEYFHSLERKDKGHQIEGW